MDGVSIERRLEVTLPPWSSTDHITFRLGVGDHCRKTNSDQARRAAAEQCLAALPAEAVWAWTDGSADGGVKMGGGGALICLPSGEEREVQVAAGKACSTAAAPGQSCRRSERL